jgi:HTH-type transcriptional regulator / antitoxin HigA
MERRPVDKDATDNMNGDRLMQDIPDIVRTWEALQHQTLLKPIRSEQDHQKMTRLAKELAGRLNGDREGPLADLVGVVCDLIHGWEKTHHPGVPKDEPRVVLRRLLETHGLKQKDLSDIASPTVISDILAGRRAISKNVAKALAERFQMDVSLFL